MAHTRTQTLERRVIVFAVLAAVLGAVLLFRPTTVTGISRDALEPLLPDFDKEVVRTIELAQQVPGSEQRKVVRLEKTSQGWVLPDRFGYASLPGAVVRLLDDVTDARERARVTTRSETFDKYRSGDGWVDLTMKDASGKKVVDLKIGRAEGTDVFVQLDRGGKPTVLRAINLRPRLASVNPATWIETQLWTNGLKASSVVRMDLVQRGVEQPIKLVKRGASTQQLGVTVPDKDPEDTSKVWWMVSPRATDADMFEVQDLARSISGLLVDDVVARIASPADAAPYGFDDPEVKVLVWEQAGEAVNTYELTIGKLTEGKDAWYVRRSDVPWVYKVAAGKNINAFRAEPSDFMPKKESTDGK